MTAHIESIYIVAANDKPSRDYRGNYTVADNLDSRISVSDSPDDVYGTLREAFERTEAKAIAACRQLNAMTSALHAVAQEEQ